MGYTQLGARRPGLIAYAVIAYASFVVTALWAIGFLADAAAPTTVDGGVRRATLTALLVDASLLLLFALQHSVMARHSVKLRIARMLPPVAERSTYVLASSLALALLYWQWQPLPGYLWHVDARLWMLAWALWTVYAIGWVIAVAATFMVDHRDFLGLRQAWLRRGEPHMPLAFTERWLYTRVRHPMMLGLLIAFWATPRMSVGHAVFAIAGTGYIAIGIQFEERDLRRQLGDVYLAYSQRVPSIVPSMWRRNPTVPPDPEPLGASRGVDAGQPVS